MYRRVAGLSVVVVLWAVAPASVPATRGGRGPRIRHYKIEVSTDGEAFTTVVDKTANDRDNAVEFDEIAPIECRYVRLTITGWPTGLPVGVLEFTVFGRPVAS